MAESQHYRLCQQVPAQENNNNNNQPRWINYHKSEERWKINQLPGKFSLILSFHYSQLIGNQVSQVFGECEFKFSAHECIFFLFFFYHHRLHNLTTHCSTYTCRWSYIWLKRAHSQLCQYRAQIKCANSGAWTVKALSRMFVFSQCDVYLTESSVLSLSLPFSL